MNTRGMHVIKLLIVFLLSTHLFFFLLQRDGCLSQEPRRVKEKLFFFLPYSLQNDVDENVYKTLFVIVPKQKQCKCNQKVNG